MAVEFRLRPTGADTPPDHVRVETGTGRITTVTPKGERNALVVIDAEHLKIDVQSWVDRQGPVWPRVQAAAADHRLIRYTIEVHRRANAAPGRLVQDYTNAEKIKDLVGLDLPDAPVVERPGQPCDRDGRPITVAAASAVASTPAPAADRPAPPREPHQHLPAVLRQLHETVAQHRPRQEVEHLTGIARDMGATDDQLERARTVRTSAADAAPPTSSPDAEATNNAGADYARKAMAEVRDPDKVAERQPDPRPVGEPAGQGPRISQASGLTRRTALAVVAEAKPWEYFNNDGTVNLGSYAAGAVTEFVKLAAGILVTRARQRATEDPDYDLRAPGADTIEALAGDLLNIADHVQSRMRDGSRVDRMAKSHALARQGVREGLDLFPIPWGADEDGRREWRRHVADHALAIALTVRSLLGPDRDA